MTELIEKFYTAFSNLDSEKMNACYHSDVTFSDPAFGQLNYAEVTSMWTMLLASQKGKNFTVTFSDIQANQDSGSAKWEAKYIFSKSGRAVHNKVSANFRFKDGLIIEHLDDFNLHSWAKQALGTSGALIGWTGFFKRKLQAQTNITLHKFMKS